MTKDFFRLSIFSFVFFLSSYHLQAQQGTVHIDQNKQIDRLLDYKKDLRNTIDAFVIQVYYGSRTEAQSVKNQVAGLFPDWSSSLEFETPKYKVWVGNFRTRLEADRALMTAKKSFPDAMVLKPKKNR